MDEGLLADFFKDVRPIIGHVKLPDLERRHIKLVVKRVKDRNVTTTVNRTLAALRRALSWAVAEEVIKINPASGVSTNVEETPKDRALSSAEIKSFWHGVGKKDAPLGQRSRIALRLALVTGQRPGEVCGALKSEVDFNTGIWTLPGTRTKNGKTHAVPLHSMAVDLFKEAMALDPESPFVFCTWTRRRGQLPNAKAMDGHALSHAMRGALGIFGLSSNPATPHDLRRTVATHMARLGFPAHHVARVLNHGTELRRTVTERVYIKHDYMNEKRTALLAWGNELEQIIGLTNSSDNIVALRTA